MPSLPMMALMPMIGMGAQVGLSAISGANRSMIGTTSLPETILGGIASQQLNKHTNGMFGGQGSSSQSGNGGGIFGSFL